MAHPPPHPTLHKLDERAVQELAGTLPAWQFDPERGGMLKREFVFDDFAQAFGFMTQVALASEQRNHHPEWSNVYNRVVIALTTHDAGGLTSKDIDLARVADRVYASGSPTR
jgi:4a-hydroxytetrahydrobiopterin dehydratase